MSLGRAKSSSQVKKSMSSNTPRSISVWVWALTKPGITAHPEASMTLAAAGAATSPEAGVTAAMLPSRTVTSPTKVRRDPSQGTTVPPRTSRSTGVRFAHRAAPSRPSSIPRCS